MRRLAQTAQLSYCSATMADVCLLPNTFASGFTCFMLLPRIQLSEPSRQLQQVPHKGLQYIQPACGLPGAPSKYTTDSNTLAG